MYQQLCVSAGVLFVCVCGFLFGILPVTQNVLATIQDTRALSTEVQALQEKTLVLQSISEDQMRYNAQLLLSGTLFDTMDGLTSQAGVSVDSVTITKPGSIATASAIQASADEKKMGSSILSISMHFTGTLPQIKSFLSAAVSVRRLLRVRSFDVSVPKVSSATGSADLLSVNAAVDAYYSPVPTILGSVDRPISLLTNTENDLIASISAMKLIQSPSIAGLPSPSAGAAKADPFSL